MNKITELFNFFKITTHQRILSLDILRGIAILLVIFHHNPTYPEARGIFYFPIVYFNSIGWAGVDLFFVLSGYLVGGLLLKEYKNNGSIRIKRFIIRRGFKIWPVYYIFLLTYLFLAPLMSSKVGEPYFISVGNIFSSIWPAFIHIQNYMISTAPIGWFWSLGVEEHFYILLPAFLHITLHKMSWHWPRNHKALFAFLFSLIGGIILIRFITMMSISLETNKAYALIFPTHLRFDALFSGVMLAALHLFHENIISKIKKVRFILPFISAGLLMIPYLYSNDHQFFLYPFGQSILTFAFWLLLLFSLFYPQKYGEINLKSVCFFNVPFIIIGKILANIGVASYSIYVWQGFLAKPVANRICLHLGIAGNDSTWGFINEIIYVLVPIMLGYLSFIFIEEPFLKLRKKLAS